MDKLPTMRQFRVLCLIPELGIGGPALREVARIGRASFYELIGRMREADLVSATPEVVRTYGEGFKQNRYRLTAAGRRAIREFREAVRA